MAGNQICFLFRLQAINFVSKINGNNRRQWQQWQQQKNKIKNAKPNSALKQINIKLLNIKVKICVILQLKTLNVLLTQSKHMFGMFINTTANSQQPTANSQQSTVNSQRQTDTTSVLPSELLENCL